MPGLHFDITADNKVFIRSVDEIERSVRSASDQIEADGGDIEAVFTRIQKAASLAAAGFSLKEFVGKVTSTRGEFQQLEVAFNTMLGSEEKAVALMDQLTRTAATTPFDLQGIANGAKQLLAYGVNAEDVNGTLIRLGDIAAGLSIPLGDLVYLYGTTMAQGRLYTQDLNQFTGRGIPMIGELAKQFGVAESQVKKLVEEGKVGFPEVQKVIENLTNEGGKFGGLMEAQSKTIVGQISNIEDAIDSMFNEIGRSSEGIINTSLGMVSSLVENWQTVGMILGDIALAYGTQKAVLVGMAAVTSSMYKAEMTALAAVLPQKQQSVNLDIAEAVSKGRLSKASAEKLIALRAEVKAQLENLAATKAAATAEAEAAAQKYRAALQQSLASKAAVAAKREELVASGQIVGSTLSENAIKEMGIVTDKAKAAAIQATAAKQEYYTAVTKKKAAVEALDTATTNANTAAQTANARSTNILTLAKQGLATATKKLYATMMANPYAVITAAVLALGYGIYKLVTYQTEAEKAQSRLDEALNKSEGAIHAENVQISILFDRLRKAKEGTEEWQRARDAIWAKYGNYLQALGDEKTALNDVEVAYKHVAAAAAEAAKARALDSLLQKEGEEYAEQYSKSYDKIFNIISEKKGKEFADKYRETISRVLSGQSKFTKEFIAQFEEIRTLTNGLGPSTAYTVNPLKDAANEGLKKAEEYVKKVKNAEDKFGVSGGRKAPATMGQEAPTEVIESGKAVAKNVAKEEDAAKKLADLMLKQAQERLQIEQDYEYERWQSRIDIMQEGEAKVLAQQELNNSKELSSLEKRKQQEIAAEIERQKALFNARKDAGQAFGEFAIDQTELDKIEARYSNLQADLTMSQQKAEFDRQRAAKESMNAYLKEFGNYQEKRLAIEEEYQAKIQAAENEGQRMQLMAQRNKALSDLDYEEWVGTGSIALAFGDISNLSDKTIAQLIADMEKYREKVIATFDPEKIQKYEEALSNLRTVRSDNSFGIFSSAIPEYFKQRKSVADQMESAEENVNALYEKRAELLDKIKKLQDLISVTGATGNDVSTLIEQLRKAEVELNDNEKASAKAKNAILKLKEEWDNLNSPQEKFEGIADAIADIGALVSSVASDLSGMFDTMGAEGLGKVVGTLGEVAGDIGNVAAQFAKGDMISGIASAAGTVFKWVGSLFALGDARHERNIQRMQKQIDALQRSYDKLGRSADDAFSTDASDLIDKQNISLQQQRILVKKQMAEEDAKKRTDDKKMQEFRDRIGEIDKTLEDNKKKAKEAIIGKDIKSAISEFAADYVSAWDDGTDAAQKSMSAVKSIITSALNELLKKRLQPIAQRFYDNLVLYMSDGILTDWELADLDDLKAQIDALAAVEEEQYKKIQDRYKDLDELREELTDISFDSVRDNFKSLLSDMESTAADFTEDFTDMLRNAMIESLMDNKYDAMLKEWYEEFAEAMRDQTLTDTERDALRQQYENIVQQGIADRDALNSVLGGGAYSQSATAGGWESMGQDTAEELNGRFTALTELQVINNDLMQTQNITTSQILATMRSMGLMTSSDGGADPTLLAIKDMMFLSTGYLEDIRKYTKILNSVDERLSVLNSTIDRKL